MFGQYRLYSADMGLTSKGWRLFEINAMPGMVNRARGHQAVYYQDKLTDFLKEIALTGRWQRQHGKQMSNSGRTLEI
jgi:hypothetical protein